MLWHNSVKVLDYFELHCKYQSAVTSQATKSVWCADPNGVIHKWFFKTGKWRKCMKVNNDSLSRTYAATSVHSWLMTYLAVVVLTCADCVNVQTLRWGQMFGRHVRALINNPHAGVYRCSLYTLYSLDILRESRRERGGVPFSAAACWYLSCQLSGSWTDLNNTLQMCPEWIYFITRDNWEVNVNFNNIVLLNIFYLIIKKMNKCADDFLFWSCKPLLDRDSADRQRTGWERGMTIQPKERLNRNSTQMNDANE